MLSSCWKLCFGSTFNLGLCVKTYLNLRLLWRGCPRDLASIYWLFKKGYSCWKSLFTKSRFFSLLVQIPAITFVVWIWKNFVNHCFITKTTYTLTYIKTTHIKSTTTKTLLWGSIIISIAQIMMMPLWYISFSKSFFAYI